VDRIARAHVKSGKTLGLSVGVRHKGAVVLSRGYGICDLSTKAPVTAHSVFRIASITKTFTAVLILQLKNEGKLTLTDTLDMFYPAFPRGRDVTVYQLLSHTSGIHDFVWGGLPPGTSKYWTTADEFVARQMKCDPPYDFEPGTRHSYSNSGYIILGGIIEKVSGQSYDAALASRIFRPLGLADTAIDHNNDKVPGRAFGYNLKDGAPGAFVPIEDEQMMPFAAGALRSSIHDMLVFQSALFDAELLPPADVQLMTMPARTKDQRLTGDARWFADGKGQPLPDFVQSLNYGLGVEIAVARGHKAISHNGGIDGFNSIMIRYPNDQLDLVILANTSNAIVAPWLAIDEALAAGTLR
jgi:CubicO group peptidase (beta-lactamase class C family)